MRARTALQALEPRLLLTTYYVSTLGDDAGDGSAAAPWQRLQVAISHLLPGDTLNIEPGVYHEGFVLGWDVDGLYGNLNGTPNSPITIQADPAALPGTVVIDERNNKTSDAIDMEPGNSWLTIRGLTITNPNRDIDRDGIHVSNSDHVSIVNCTVDSARRFGIFCSFTTDFVVQGNTVTNTIGNGDSGSGHGIYISNSDINPVIRSNTIAANATQGLHLNGDISQGGIGMIQGALIEGNVIYDNGANGINGDGVTNSRIQNNLIYNNGKHGIVLYHIDAAFGSTGNLIINNTIAQPASFGAAIELVSGSTGNTIYNNILLGGAHGTLIASEDSLPGLVSDYNIVLDQFEDDDTEESFSLAQWQADSGQDLHSFMASPDQLFADASSNDYHLALTSPALDAGTSLFAPPVDIAGQSRPLGTGIDLGAYEGSQAPVPDTLPPTAILHAPDVLRGKNTYDFQVAYVDDTAIAVQSIGSGDLLVQGPLGYLQSAILVSINRPTNGNRRTATYRITAPGGSWEPGDGGLYTIVLNPGQVIDVAGNPVAEGVLGTFTVNIVLDSTVIDRNIVYADSAYGDFASDKTALLPGQTATFANYTSFDLGINEIVIDIHGPVGKLEADDFIFRVGNSNTPSAWNLAPAPLFIAIDQGDSPGTSRVSIFWDDGSIINQWLQVTMLSNPNTGLMFDDVFYFGNAIGDSGDSTTDAKVNATDEIAARAHCTSPLDETAISNPYDYNRDGVVDVTDQQIARAHVTNFLNALTLITVPGFTLPGDSAPENAAPGAVVGTFTNTDPASPATSTYQLALSWAYPDNACFAIVGNVLMTAQTFDFETKANYTIAVTRLDASGATFLEVLHITIADANEPPTDITLSSQTVPENLPAGTSVGQLSTVDPDTGDHFTYTMATGTGDADNAAFAIQGNLLQTASTFDFETRTIYHVRIRATDSGGFSTEKTFTIFISDANDPPQDLLISNDHFDENQPPGSDIGEFSTVDPDSGDTFSYSLVAGEGDTDNTSFVMSGDRLEAVVSFDFETQSVYSVRVRTTDSGGATFEKVFLIFVNNIDEPAPPDAPDPSLIAAPSTTVNQAIDRPVAGAQTTPSYSRSPLTKATKYAACLLALPAVHKSPSPPSSPPCPRHSEAPVLSAKQPFLRSEDTRDYSGSISSGRVR